MLISLNITTVISVPERNFEFQSIPLEGKAISPVKCKLASSVIRYRDPDYIIVVTGDITRDLPDTRLRFREKLVRNRNW